MLEIDGIKIKWTGHDGFKLQNKDNIIYIDPFKLIEKYQQIADADIILISHNHFDHLSIADISNIINEKTKLVCANECNATLKQNYPKNDIIVLSPGDSTKIGDINIQATEAYNTNKNFHPKKDQKIGFILTVNGSRLYHTGDTDIIPEMSGINPDILFAPVSGTYVMTAEEAVKATNELIKPSKIAIPMHYNSIVGTVKDAEKYCKEINVCKTAILEIE